jgi:hypothetical protein
VKRRPPIEITLRLEEHASIRSISDCAEDQRRLRAWVDTPWVRELFAAAYDKSAQKLEAQAVQRRIEDR